MSQRNILIVAVDGFRASALGAYGNTSFGTPAFDQFAAESFALDWCFAPAVEVTELYHAFWYSQHPSRLTSKANPGSSLPRLLSTGGYHTTVVTDDPQLSKLAATVDFDQFVDVGPTNKPHRVETRADDIATTAIAQLFASACKLVVAKSDDSPRLVWVHSRGMYGPWDAPLELQQTLLDEDDPPPVEAVVAPDLLLGKEADPDAVFRYSCAYAGQVMALDACWKALMDAVRQDRKNEWLVMLVGVRGYPLGEHGRIGGVDTRLYGEQLHVPALLSFPDGVGRLARCGALTSHVDFLPTLVHWLENRPLKEVDGTSLLPLVTAARTAWRDAVISSSASGSRAIRTADWCLRQDCSSEDKEKTSDLISSEVTNELFVRPDDRWEANDVAKLCPEVVETLSDAIEEVSRRLAQNESVPVNVIPSESPACGS